jgi:hypothetical protein
MKPDVSSKKVQVATGIVVIKKVNLTAHFR